MSGLGRDPATISRELRRNRDPDSGQYRPFAARRIAAGRRARPGRGKLERDAVLRQFVAERLEKRWSPKQISHALRCEFPGEPERHVVHAVLLGEGIYLGSVSTFYRLLRQAGKAGSAARRPFTRRPSSPRSWWRPVRPGLTWDITKLLGPAKWTYYHLYVIIEFTAGTRPGGLSPRASLRGWPSTSSRRPARSRAHLPPTLRPRRSRHLHDLQDRRAAPRRSRRHPVHSRPHVSNDNPYSEAQFKTLKYRPGFPTGSAPSRGARAHCQEFFPWSATSTGTAASACTPRPRHRRPGRTSRVLTAAYHARPNTRPQATAPPKLPGTSWINPPEQKVTTTQQAQPTRASFRLDSDDNSLNRGQIR